MRAPRKCPDKLREHAQRLVTDAMSEEPSLSLHAAVNRIGPRAGILPDTLHRWCEQARIGSGPEAGTTSPDAKRITELETAVSELKRVNEILMAADSLLASSRPMSSGDSAPER